MRQASLPSPSSRPAPASAAMSPAGRLRPARPRPRPLHRQRPRRPHRATPSRGRIAWPPAIASCAGSLPGSMRARRRPDRARTTSSRRIGWAARSARAASSSRTGAIAIAEATARPGWKTAPKRSFATANAAGENPRFAGTLRSRAALLEAGISSQGLDRASSTLTPPFLRSSSPIEHSRLKRA